MKNVWQELIALNARGVTLMQQGEWESAEADFTHGLRLLQRSINSIELFVPSRKSSQNGLTVSIFSHKMAIQNSDFLGLFDRALVISGENLPDSSLDQRLAAYSGIFLYNLALTLHVRGLLQGYAKRFSRALEMYGLAWQSFQITGAAYMQVELGLLACTNNIAHIHRYHHRMADVTSCGEWMCRRLQDAPSSIPKQERFILTLNVFFYKQKDVSSAAVA